LGCSESATKDFYRHPRLFVDLDILEVILYHYYDSHHWLRNILKNDGLNLFVPCHGQIYLGEAKLDPFDPLLSSQIPMVIYGGGGVTLHNINGLDLFENLHNYLKNIIQLNHVYAAFKDSYYGAEITLTNQLFRFFSYVEKRINLLISKVELIQEQGKIFGSFSGDIFRQELGNSVLDLINVVNLKVEETGSSVGVTPLIHFQLR
ncbi:MAG: hypothetical protein ACKN9E_16850, partial [Microcystaceae cyanobacterium]